MCVCVYLTCVYLCFSQRLHRWGAYRSHGHHRNSCQDRGPWPWVCMSVFVCIPVTSIFRVQVTTSDVALSHETLNYTYIHVYTHTYIRTYIHTYIHTISEILPVTFIFCVQITTSDIALHWTTHTYMYTYIHTYTQRPYLWRLFSASKSRQVT